MTTTRETRRAPARVGVPQRSRPAALAHSRRRSHHPHPLPKAPHDSARMTEIPLMSSLFITTID